MTSNIMYTFAVVDNESHPLSSSFEEK